MPWSEAEKKEFRRHFKFNWENKPYIPKRKYKWWLGDPERCQGCGHRERDHRDYGFFILCRDDCFCKAYEALPEHDFSEDPPYDYNAYGEEPPENVEMTQRMITGMGHTKQCLQIMKWKQQHIGCRCYCHD